MSGAKWMRPTGIQCSIAGISCRLNNLLRKYPKSRVFVSLYEDILATLDSLDKEIGVDTKSKSIVDRLSLLEAASQPKRHYFHLGDYG